MAVKCNIASKALIRLANSQWGFSKDKSTDISIVENYLEYLGCPSFSLKLCTEDYSSICEQINKSNVQIVNCNINLIGISFVPIENEENGDISFYLAVGDIYGAKQPITYKWTFDESDFEIIGSDEEPVINLKAVNGKDPALIVSAISLEITDANGCTDTKQCYYTPTGMKCNNSFAPCLGVSGLNVAYLFNECSKAKSLTVSNV